VTAAIQVLLWRDKKIAARAESEGSLAVSLESGSPPLEAGEFDEKKPVRDDDVKVVSLD